MYSMVNRGIFAIENWFMDKKMITVYAESTPNPAALKFVTDRLLNPGSSMEFSATNSSASPLASALLKFPFIQTVFISSNFITLTKSDVIEWNEVMGELRDFIKQYIENGNKIWSADDLIKDDTKSSVSSLHNDRVFSPEEQRIESILNEYIKPAVEGDGGAISLISFTDGIVKVSLQGSCSGCPSSSYTLKAGIEGLLKRLVPEVQSVVAE